MSAHSEEMPRDAVSSFTKTVKNILESATIRITGQIDQAFIRAYELSYKRHYAILEKITATDERERETLKQLRKELKMAEYDSLTLVDDNTQDILTIKADGTIEPSNKSVDRVYVGGKKGKGVVIDYSAATWKDRIVEFSRNSPKITQKPGGGYRIIDTTDVVDAGIFALEPIIKERANAIKLFRAFMAGLRVVSRKPLHDIAYVLYEEVKKRGVMIEY